MNFKTKYNLGDTVWVVKCEERFSRRSWSIKGEGKIDRINIEHSKYAGRKARTHITYLVSLEGYVNIYTFFERHEEYHLFRTQNRAKAFCKRRNIECEQEVATFEKNREEYLKKFEIIRKKAKKKLEKLRKKEQQKCIKSQKPKSASRSRSRKKPTTRPRTRSRTSSRTKSK